MAKKTITQLVEDDWEIRDNYHTIKRAIEILRDSSAMEKVRKYASEQIKLSKEVTDLSEEYLKSIGLGQK